MATNYPVNPRVRAYGKARIDIAQRAQNPADWEKMWKYPSHPFPFVWSESWKQNVEYKVDDFAAEVGFFIDVLGLPVYAFDPAYAMFTSPQADFFFSVRSTPPGETSTPPDALRLQFMVADIFTTTSELKNRDISFELLPEPIQAGSPIYVSYFRTPHGIPVDLWGMVEIDQENPTRMSQTSQVTGENRPSGELDQDDPDEGDADDESEEDDEEDFPDDADVEEGEIEFEINADGFKRNGNGAGHGDADEEDEEIDEGEDDDEFEEDEGDGGLDEDEEDDDLDLDEDDEYDDDEDEYDSDEDRLTLVPSAKKGESASLQPTTREDNRKPQSRFVREQAAQSPEYIDLDIT